MYLPDGVHLMRISWVAIWRVDQGGVGVTIDSALQRWRVRRQTVDHRLGLDHLCGEDPVQQPHPGQQ